MPSNITIKAYKKANYKGEVGTWLGAYNPEDMTLKFKNRFTNNPANGISKSPSYAGPETPKMTFQIIFDNTNYDLSSTSKQTVSISQQVEEFKKLIFVMNGDSHQSNFLIIISGKLIFKGQCESLNVKYTSFNREGEPRRAFVDLVLLRSEDLSVLRAEIQQSSPDMTHYLQLLAGDGLPLIANRYFENPRYCFELAMSNRLASPRKVPVGTPITVPPLSQPDSQ